MSANEYDVARRMLIEDLLEHNEWLAAPENEKAPKWLRDLETTSRDQARQLLEKLDIAGESA